MKINDGIIGLAVGDALGVPCEFNKREKFKINKVIEMVKADHERAPKGSWSDDTSMVIATMDSIVNHGINYNEIANSFLRWLLENEYCAHDISFGVGNTTFKALMLYNRSELDAIECGGRSLHDNGNGSLMRILPIVYYCYYNKLDDKESYEIIKNTSYITHIHEISVLGCFLYYKYVSYILGGLDKIEAYNKLKTLKLDIFNDSSLNEYRRILKDDIYLYNEDDISSSGYVVHTLEAALWSFITTDNFKDCIIKAVNLGDDADTVGAVVGGIAGIYYGYENTPSNWLNDLVKLDYLLEMSNNFESIFKKES